MPLHNKDYILRIIEELGRAFSRLIGMLRDPSPEDLERVDQDLSGLGQNAGFDLDLVDALSPDTLELMLGSGGEIDVGRTWLLAELLYLRAIVAGKAGRAELATRRLVRSSFLFRLLPAETPAAEGLPDPADRIADIDRRLGPAEGRADKTAPMPMLRGEES